MGKKISTPLNLDDIKAEIGTPVAIPKKHILSRQLLISQGKLDHLIGECYINFEKLLDGVISISNAEENQEITFGASSLKKFEEKLWYCGHSIGQVEGEIILENMPFLS